MRAHKKILATNKTNYCFSNALGTSQYFQPVVNPIPRQLPRQIQK